MFIMGVDLGQTQDYTAISVLERVEAGDGPAGYMLRYLERPELGTPYPAIISRVLTLLDRPPLSRTETPLVVDRTGVGAPVVDMFTQAGVQPHALTITNGDEANTTDPYHLRVPKRDLALGLVALYQTQRLQVAKALPLAPTLTAELMNFKVKFAPGTGHASYEAWRESDHDDLVLSVAMAAWYGEHVGSGVAGVWFLNMRPHSPEQDGWPWRS